MAWFNELVLTVETVWGTFFAWMPLSVQILVGAIIGVCMVVLVFKIAALVWNALPFF